MADWRPKWMRDLNKDLYQRRRKIQDAAGKALSDAGTALSDAQVTVGQGINNIADKVSEVTDAAGQKLKEADDVRRHLTTLMKPVITGEIPKLDEFREALDSKEAQAALALGKKIDDQVKKGEALVRETQSAADDAGVIIYESYVAPVTGDASDKERLGKAFADTDKRVEAAQRVGTAVKDWGEKKYNAVYQLVTEEQKIINDKRIKELIGNDGGVSYIIQPEDSKIVADMMRLNTKVLGIEGGGQTLGEVWRDEKGMRTVPAPTKDVSAKKMAENIAQLWAIDPNTLVTDAKSTREEKLKILSEVKNTIITDFDTLKALEDLKHNHVPGATEAFDQQHKLYSMLLVEEARIRSNENTKTIVEGAELLEGAAWGTYVVGTTATLAFFTGGMSLLGEAAFLTAGGMAAEAAADKAKDLTIGGPKFVGSNEAMDKLVKDPTNMEALKEVTIEGGKEFAMTVGTLGLSKLFKSLKGGEKAAEGLGKAGADAMEKAEDAAGRELGQLARKGAQKAAMTKSESTALEHLKSGIKDAIEKATKDPKHILVEQLQKEIDELVKKYGPQLNRDLLKEVEGERKAATEALRQATQQAGRSAPGAGAAGQMPSGVTLDEALKHLAPRIAPRGAQPAIQNAQQPDPAPQAAPPQIPQGVPPQSLQPARIPPAASLRPAPAATPAPGSRDADSGIRMNEDPSATPLRPTPSTTRPAPTVTEPAPSRTQPAPVIMRPAPAATPAPGSRDPDRPLRMGEANKGSQPATKGVPRSRVIPPVAAPPDDEDGKAAKEAREKAEKEARDKTAKEAREKTEREAREKAEKEAREKAEKEARDKTAKEAREKTEREAREKAEKEARDKTAKEAREKTEREAREKAEKEARDKTAKEAREKTEREAREKAEKEARDKTAKEAREKTEREAREKAEKEARDKTAKEAREKTEREAREKAEKEARDKTAKEAREKTEREAREKAEKEARDKTAKEAREKTEREAREKAEKEARDKTAKEAREKPAGSPPKDTKLKDAPGRPVRKPEATPKKTEPETVVYREIVQRDTVPPQRFEHNDPQQSWQRDAIVDISNPTGKTVVVSGFDKMPDSSVVLNSQQAEGTEAAKVLIADADRLFTAATPDFPQGRRPSSIADLQITTAINNDWRQGGKLELHFSEEMKNRMTKSTSQGADGITRTALTVDNMRVIFIGGEDRIDVRFDGQTKGKPVEKPPEKPKDLATMPVRANNTTKPGVEVGFVTYKDDKGIEQRAAAKYDAATQKFTTDAAIADRRNIEYHSNDGTINIVAQIKDGEIKQDLAFAQAKARGAGRAGTEVGYITYKDAAGTEVIDIVRSVGNKFVSDLAFNQDYKNLDYHSMDEKIKTKVQIQGGNNVFNDPGAQSTPQGTGGENKTSTR